MGHVSRRDSLRRSLLRQTSGGHKLALAPRSADTRQAAYFACRDSTYWVRFATRCCTSASCPPLTLRNNGPQTGISLDPCAGRSDVPRRIELTFRAGNFPPLFLLSTVRSAGGVFSALAAGPPPLPSVPWQTAQYAVYISLPDTGDVDCIGTCFIVFSDWS